MKGMILLFFLFKVALAIQHLSIQNMEVETTGVISEFAFNIRISNSHISSL